MENERGDASRAEDEQEVDALKTAEWGLSTPTYDFALFLPVLVAVGLVILDGSLFDITAIAKLLLVCILLFWADSQEGVEFLEFPGDPRAGLLFISHIVVPNKVAVGAQDDALLDFFLNPIQANPITDCISNVKLLILCVKMVKL
jgi:hypothetical protein